MFGRFLGAFLADGTSVMACIVITLGLFPAACIAAEDADSALMASCPGLSTWAEKHPRNGQNSHDKSRPTAQAALGSEISRRVDLDQRARAFMTGGKPPTPEELSNLAIVDADNLRWLKDQVARLGFPTENEVGKQGVSDAWLLVQHADSDPEFQHSVLGTLMADASRASLRPEIAMLSDRVRLAQGKAQTYGTQFIRGKDGHLVLKQPVEDLVGIDARRASMDLMPIKPYQCVLHVTYDPPSGG